MSLMQEQKQALNVFTAYSLIIYADLVDGRRMVSIRFLTHVTTPHQGNCTSCDGRDDVKEFAHFESALKILTFTENDLWEISKLLAAILHLGNVDFEGKGSH